MARRAIATMRIAALALLLPGAGCMSYKVCGHADAGYARHTGLRRTYNLQRIEIRGTSPVPVVLWTTDFALSKTPADEYRRLVVRNRPDVFSENPGGIPVSAEISLRSSMGSRGGSFLVPYLVTLGILPFQIQYDDVCGVTVRRLDIPYSTPESTFKFQHRMMETVFSTIGFGGFAPDPTATSERSGSGILAQPEINANVRQNIAEALAETMAATIVAQLRQMEAAEQPASLIAPAAVPAAPPVAAAIPTAAPLPAAPPAATPPDAPAPSQLTGKLQKLKALRDSGAITEQEYLDLTVRTLNSEK